MNDDDTLRDALQAAIRRSHGQLAAARRQGDGPREAEARDGHRRNKAAWDLLFPGEPRHFPDDE